MDSPIESVNREDTSPFLLKLFHRTGTFHRPDEFTSSHELPKYITIYTWPTATLREITHLLAAASPSVLPTPAIGTRVAYRLFYHDTRGNPSAPRLATQELGSVVIGDGGPGIVNNEGEEDDDDDDVMEYSASSLAEEGRLKDGATKMVGSEAEAEKTLADARFVVGDFVSVAILPPSTVDGSVQPVPSARTGWASSFGAGPARRRSSATGEDSGGFGDAGKASGRYARPVGHLMGGDRRFGSRENAVPPMGEWRRGERLPEVPPSRGRGRRRW